MTIEDDIFFLERVTTFAQLGFSALQIIAIGSEARHLESGEVLFAAGDTADGGYVIQEGSLKLALPNADESDPGITVGPGVLLGELALVTETRRPVTATAIEPSTVMRITRSLFRKVLEGFPDAALLMRDRLTERANEAADELYAVRGLLDPPGTRR
jgi:CRP-like cAMP-binding protein